MSVSSPYRTLSASLLLLLALAMPLRAQPDTSRPAIPPPDSSTFTREDEPENGLRMTKSPLLATVLSIVPGAGQLYNEDYWKVPLFAAAGGFFVYRTLYYHNLFINKVDELEAMPDVDSTVSRRLSLRTQREFYRDNRDLNFAYFLGVEILSMIDAYVGAHLFDFDVDDDISSRIMLDPERMGVRFMMRW
jgi:hypothetical protein